MQFSISAPATVALSRSSTAVETVDAVTEVPQKRCGARLRVLLFGAAIVAIAFVVGCGSTTQPQPDGAPVEAKPAPPKAAAQAPVDDVLQAGLESQYVLEQGDGSAMLGVVVRAPETDAPAPDPSVALSLVIDTSGSMEGEKIEHARFAARRILESARDGDMVSVHAFASNVEEVTPLIELDSAVRAELIQRVEALQATSSTALYDGTVAGLTAVSVAPRATKRLILLSDGMANVGPATPEDVLAALPPSIDKVTLSTIGVGVDYDDKVMVAVAERGRGGFHHLTDPVQMAGIMEAELARARTVAGRDAVIEIVPAPGVEILDAVGVTLKRQADGRVRIPVGALYAGEDHSVSIKVKVPTKNVSKGRVGTVAVRFQDAAGADIDRTAEVGYLLTSSPTQVEQGQEPVFMVAADRQRVAHVLIDAAALLKDGDLLEAQAILRDERTRLLKRRGRLDGAEKTEVDTLIEMFRDPYVDAQVGAAPSVQTVSIDTVLDAIVKAQAVDESALGGFSKKELRILRNAAYARHGYRFKSADLRGFFGKKSWYRPDAGFDHRRLAPQDVKNVALIKAYENRAGLMAKTRRAPRKKGDQTLAKAVELARMGQSVGGLDALTLRELRTVRNAVYARHGYAFRSSDLRAYFGKLPWYAVDSSYSPNRLTPTDTQTVRAIKAREQALVRGGGDAVRDFELRSRARAHRAIGR